MIKVEKNFSNIPSVLTETGAYSRKDVFTENISAEAYIDKKNKYKIGSIQKKLKEIYNLKCAYCEQKLLDAPKHIEHYRPKKTYYWLAYSWDNLLLSCGSCNSAKNDNFVIQNTQVVYNNETFSEVQNLSDSYNSSEEPLIINPEHNDILDLIMFDKDGHISSQDIKVDHTITNACNLNREELVQLRVEIITDFINRINLHFHYFSKYKDPEVFTPDIKTFVKNCKVENSFYAFRYFVSRNIELFFPDNTTLQEILKKYFSKLND